MKNTPYYSVKPTSTNETLRFMFASVGIKTIIKAIEYSPLTSIDGQTIYNLGFGDYNEESGDIEDEVSSNNGDIYIVFNTVLHTVPTFFSKYPNDFIIVSGSDSSEKFAEKCKLTCKKRTKCNEGCINVHRRINIYKYYVDNNFEEVCKNYLIYGRNLTNGINFVPYVPNSDYHEILVRKKDNNGGN